MKDTISFMPLITCPDCGSEVSTAAAACPHCGRPMAPVAAPTPQATAGAEETLWRGTPSLALVSGKIFGVIVAAIVIPLILYFFYDQLAQYAHWIWIILALILLWLIGGIGIAIARIKATIYKVTTQRVIIETGLTTKKVEDIDLRTIDDTQFQQRFIERLLGIGNVTITSSDKVAPNYVLHGVHDPRALRELIRANAYHVSQRQLFTRAT
jgi:membrane protein YdbS with pleckstrin-like domain